MQNKLYILILVFLFPVFVFGQINMANNAVTLGGTVGFMLNSAATLWMLGFDVHFEIHSFGTPDEFPSH